MDDGTEVGTDTATRHRVVSAEAARQTALMMERVIDSPVAASPRAPRCPATAWPARPAPPSGSAGGRLRRHVHGLLRRVRARRRPALHDLRRRPGPRQRRWRLGGRPGLRQADELRAASLPGAADQHTALAPARRMEMSEDHCVAFAPDRPQHSEPIALRVLADALGARVVGSADGVEVTGFTLSSQRVRPGDLYAALPGSRSHGIAFAGDAAASGAVAVLTDPGGAAAAGELALPLLVVDAPRAVLGPTAARIYGDPAALDADDRGHRHPGQDHDHAAGRGRHAGRRHRRRSDRHRRHQGRRRRGQDQPHHPRGARPARPLRGDARARRRGLRDGGLEPRAGARPGRRGGLRRRGLPQPRPRPPRLPHATSRTTSPPRRPCSPPSARGWRCSTSTTSTAAGWRDETSLPVRTMSVSGSRRRLDRQRRRPHGVRLDVRGPRPRRADRSPAAARCRVTSTSPTPSRPSRPAARPGWTPRRSRPAS